MADLIAPFTALSVLAGLYYRYRNDAIGSPVRLDPKIPRAYISLPIVGALRGLAIDVDDFNNYLASDFALQKTQVLALSIPGQPTFLFTICAADLEWILSKNFENYVKGEDVNKRLSVMFGNGIFATDGQNWVFQRKVAAKVFTTKAFKNIFETVFMDNISVLRSRLEHQSLTQGEVDMHDIFHRFFMDSFGKIAFGIDLESLTGKDVPFASAFDRSQSVLVYRFLSPFFKIEEFFKPQIQRDFKMVREFGLQVVKDRREGKIKGLEGDLISLFFKYKDEDGESLTDEQMVDQVINFLIAGRDTTAQALSWTMYCLSRNPRCVDTMLEEINRITDGNEIPTYDQVKEMKYTKAVFQETLRLYPSVPKNLKFAIKDDVLPSGTKVPAGTLVGWFAYGMGRSEKIWDEPLAFKPERWLMGKTYSQYEYPAFNAGPRICLGKTLAELQGVLVLATITKHFIFRPVKVLSADDKRDQMHKLSLTLPMKKGFNVYVAQRK